jgi:hypothetical protein
MRTTSTNNISHVNVQSTAYSPINDLHNMPSAHLNQVCTLQLLSTCIVAFSTPQSGSYMATSPVCGAADRLIGRCEQTNHNQPQNENHTVTALSKVSRTKWQAAPHHLQLHWPVASCSLQHRTHPAGCHAQYRHSTQLLLVIHYSASDDTMMHATLAAALPCCCILGMLQRARTCCTCRNMPCWQ